MLSGGRGVKISFARNRQVFKPIVGNIQSLLIPDIEKFINLGPDCLVKTYRKIFIQKNMIFNPQILIYLHAL